MQTDVVQFAIKQEAFEGPVEVLLELIEKRKVFVGDISLAGVTDDFITYIQERGMHPDLVANFLAVAATLILIKAKSLLPNLELTTDENESISDLERRLALYAIIRNVSGELSKRYGKSVSFSGKPAPRGVIFAPDESVTLVRLQELALGAIRAVPAPVPKRPEARVAVTISIAEVLETLETRIQKLISGTFDDVRVASPDADPKSQKVYTIVSFLGMLELVRRGLIAADQHENFATIQLERPTT